MAETTVAEVTVAEVMAELAALEDPRIREVNEKHGDDHGVNLGKLRALAKRLKTQQELARQLWETDDSAARLLALLICRPRAFERDELDVMLREARTPKVHDWLVNYVVKKNPHAEALRLAWSADPDPVVASAGWALTTERVAKQPEGLDLAGLLDVIEAQMKDAPDRLQWAMNHCLAQIGIEHAEHRARAIDIGERLEVLKDYPTPPNCTSPYAPIWITEMVRRQQLLREGFARSRARRRCPGRRPSRRHPLRTRPGSGRPAAHRNRAQRDHRQAQRRQAHRRVLGVARLQGGERRRPLGAVLQDGGAGADDEPAQAPPVLVVAVDQQHRLGALAEVAQSAQGAGVAPLGLAVHGDVQPPADAGVADGDGVWPAPGVCGGQAPDALRVQELPIVCAQHGSRPRSVNPPGRRPAPSRRRRDGASPRRRGRPAAAPPAGRSGCPAGGPG